MKVKSVTGKSLEEVVGAIKRTFLVIALFSLFINLLMLTAPLYMMQLFDRVLTSRSVDTLLMLLMIASVALIALGALETVRSFVMIRMSTWIEKRLGQDVFRSILTQSVRRASEPTVQALRDLSNLRNTLAGPSMFPILDAPWAPIFLGVLFILHPILGWISIAGAVTLFGLALLNELLTRGPLQQASGASLMAMQDAEASVRNADSVEAMGMSNQVIRRWQARNAEALALQATASNRSGVITSISKTIRLFLQIAILSAGAWLVLQNEMAPGAMIAGSILMGRALAPVEQAIGSWKSMVGARTSYARLQMQLQNDAQAEPGMPLPKPKGHIKVEELTYALPGATRPILRNVSFELPAGEILGLVGPTAAGKTTLARALIGNIQARGGVARLDGMDITQWHKDDLGQHIGYLPQDIELFSGTIQENIARFTEASPEQVIEAAKMADVHELIMTLPQGYDTEIGNAGMALSGGQRQRIGLARALFGNPSFIVLDEPNANLDTEGEDALMRALQALKQRGATTILITHRSRILKFLDKILVMKEGGVNLFGPADEILSLLSNARAGGQPAPQKPAAPPTAIASADTPARRA